MLAGPLHDHVYAVSPMNTGVCTVVTLRKGDVKVDVVQALSFSALFPVSLFWTTLLMNVITRKGEVITYPDATMARCGLLSADVLDADGNPRQYIQPLIEKYQSRGFQFYGNIESLPASLPSAVPYRMPSCSDTVAKCGHPAAYCPQTSQGFEDCHSLRVAFSQEGSDFMMQSTVIQGEWMASWRLGGWDGRESYRGRACAFNRFTGDRNYPHQFKQANAWVGRQGITRLCGG